MQTRRLLRVKDRAVRMKPKSTVDSTAESSGKGWEPLRLMLMLGWSVRGLILTFNQPGLPFSSRWNIARTR